MGRRLFTLTFSSCFFLHSKARCERRRECAIALLEDFKSNPFLIAPQNSFYEPAVDQGSGSRDPYCFVVFDFAGPDLRQALRRNGGGGFGFSLEWTKTAVFDLLEALKFIHMKGYIHRDVKPENCFWGPDSLGRNRLRLGDFGLTRKLDSTMTPQMVTRWYRSPELLMAERSYGPGVDMFAAGLCSVEVLTGCPFAPGGTETDQLDRYWRQLGGPAGDCASDAPTDSHGLTGGTGAQNIRRQRLCEFIFKQKPAYHAALHSNGEKGEDLLLALCNFVDLVSRLLAWDPSNRLNAEEAQCHAFFGIPHSDIWEV